MLVVLAMGQLDRTMKFLMTVKTTTLWVIEMVIPALHGITEAHSLVGIMIPIHSQQLMLVVCANESLNWKE
jgi:hypothetical protein